MVKTQGKLFIVSGPSGVGKTTVVQHFLQKYSQNYQVDRVVTYTTKVARHNEVDGIDYHFIDQAEFERKISDGFFLEWSGQYGACYGTPVHIIEKLSSGQSYIIVIDRFGAEQILHHYKEAILIWIQVDHIKLLEQRLNLRKTDSFEQIQTRLILAQKEMEQELHNPLYHYHITNNELKVATDKLSELILPRVQLIKKDME